MKSDDARGLAFFEMAADSVSDVRPQLLPGVRLRHDGMAEGARDEAAFGLVLADFKNDLVQGFTVSRDGPEREAGLAIVFRRLQLHRPAGD